MTFEYSDLTIELFSITRERLLQQVQTNLTTWGFESGEYLYILLADRDYETYTIRSTEDCAPTAQHAVNVTGWDDIDDFYTKLGQIPVKLAWSRRFTWPKLDHNYL